MKTIRRIYFYLISAISIELILWGAIQLLRSILQPDLTGLNTQSLSIGIAQVAVSIPIFLIHWLTIQSDIRKSDEERDSIIRPLFLYGISLGTLIPVVQNLLALINRLFLVGAGESRMTALVGQSQSSLDNAIAIVLNLVVAWYFWRILDSNQNPSESLPSYESVLRVYRYFWMLYGLGITVLGIDLVILDLLTQTQNAVYASSARLVNPLALLAIGTPIWVVASLSIRKTLHNQADQYSAWRIGILFGLIFIGAISTLFAWVNLLQWSLRLTLDLSIDWNTFLQKVRATIAILVPFVVFWLYYHKQFEGNLDKRSDVYEVQNLRRIMHYPIALVGLVTLIVGALGLTRYLIDVVIMQTMSFGGAYSLIPVNMATLLVGLMYWVRFFLPENSISMRSDELGIDARRSMIRKVYLYIIVFGTIVGVMASAGVTLYQIFEGSLNGRLENNAANIYKGLAQLLIFGVFLWYHLANLRRDTQLKANRLAEMHANFPVLIAESADSQMGKELQLVFSRQIPAIPVEFSAEPSSWLEGNNPRAVVISADNRMNYQTGWPEKLLNYKGKIITTPAADQQTIWSQLPESPEATAKSITAIIRLLAEERETPTRKTVSAWLIVGYIFGGFFLIQLLLLGISVIFRF